MNKLYNIDYLNKTTDLFKEIKELSYAPFKEISDGTIADIGCGTGADVVQLARLAKPTTKIIGLDADPQMIKQAESISVGLNNVQYLVGDAMELPFKNESISGIRSERLTQHLQQPEKLFNDCYRALKNESPILIVETDWTSVCFYNGMSQITTKVKNYLAQHFVANGSAANNLFYYLENAGFHVNGIRVCPLISNSLNQVKTFMKLDYALAVMQKDKYLSREEQGLFLSLLQQADANNTFVCTINFLIVSAMK